MPIVMSIADDDSEGHAILIEVDTSPNGGGYRSQDLRALGDEQLARVGDLYGKALDLANDCAQKIHQKVISLAATVRPSEYEVQFGIKMDAELGTALIAKSNVGAQLQVKLKWVMKQEKGE